MDFSKGGQIRTFQILYKQYSRLAFTWITDRPLAIAGLEQRLIRAFETYGGFGIFERYLIRSLLWKRASDVAKLKKIDFSNKPGIIVPTWSWMAYEGGIDFMDLPFDGVDWETNSEQIRSPWAPNRSTQHTWLSAGRRSNIYLRATPKEFQVDHDAPLDQSQLEFDEGKEPEGRVVRCVVVGRQKMDVLSSMQRHYVLLVSQKPGAREFVYERVGVGLMPGIWIKKNGTLSEVQIG